MKKKHIILLLLICLLFTGCKEKSDTETKETLDLISNDTKYVVQIANNQYYIFYYKDEVVTDFEMCIYSNDESIRELLYKDYNLLINVDNNIDEVKEVGNYVVVNYKEGYVMSEYGTESIQDIKDLYDHTTE